MPGMKQNYCYNQKVYYFPIAVLAKLCCALYTTTAHHGVSLTLHRQEYWIQLSKDRRLQVAPSSFLYFVVESVTGYHRGTSGGIEREILFCAHFYFVLLCEFNTWFLHTINSSMWFLDMISLFSDVSFLYDIYFCAVFCWTWFVYFHAILFINDSFIFNGFIITYCSHHNLS